MKKYDFDLFTIGAGSGGVSGSRRAASHGARVAICEESRIGGTCVIRGCVPKKILSYGADFTTYFKAAAAYGWHLENPPTFTWHTLLDNKNREIDRLNGIYKKLLADSQVTVIEGRGILLDNHTIQVGNKTYTAERILLAMGARPFYPEWQGIEHTVTSNEILELPTLPKRMAVIGAGYIAIEFASIFNALGVEVHLIIRHDKVVRYFDSESASFLTTALEQKGITIHRHAVIEKIESLAQGEKQIHLKGTSPLTTDVILNATGRIANTEAMGLETAGIQLHETDKSIIVDEKQQTTAENIFAVGDVTNAINLTPFAIRQARALAEHWFNHQPLEIHADNVPSAVFSNPPMATVGLSEEQALKQGHTVDVYTSTFRPMFYTLPDISEKMFMKLVVDAKTNIVLGCHVVGKDAPEIIQGFAVALNCKATKQDFDKTTGVHPSSAEEFVTMTTKRTVSPA